MRTTAGTLLSLLLLTARGAAAEPPALAAKEDAANNSSSLPPEQPPEGGPILGAPEHDRRQKPGRHQEPPRGPAPTKMGIRLVAPPKHGPSAAAGGASTAGGPAAQSTPAEARSPAPPVMPAPRQLQEQGNGVDANGEPDCGDNAAFVALSARVMQSCCPASSVPNLGGRRQLQSAGNPACWSGAYNANRCCDVTKGPTGDASCWAGTFDFHFCCPAPAPVTPAPGEAETGSHECELPETCDSTDCADEYLSYFDACYPHLSGLPADQFRRFDAFKAGCEASTPPLKLQPCFRACSCV